MAKLELAKTTAHGSKLKSAGAVRLCPLAMLQGSRFIVYARSATTCRYSVNAEVKKKVCCVYVICLVCEKAQLACLIYWQREHATCPKTVKRTTTTKTTTTTTTIGRGILSSLLSPTVASRGGWQRMNEKKYPTHKHIHAQACVHACTCVLCTL